MCCRVATVNCNLPSSELAILLQDNGVLEMEDKRFPWRTNLLFSMLRTGHLLFWIACAALFVRVTGWLDKFQTSSSSKKIYYEQSIIKVSRLYEQQQPAAALASQFESRIRFSRRQAIVVLAPGHSPSHSSSGNANPFLFVVHDCPQVFGHPQPSK